MHVVIRFDFNNNPGAAVAWQSYAPETGSGSVFKNGGGDTMVAASNAGVAYPPSDYGFSTYLTPGFSVVDGSITANLSLGNSSDMIQLIWRLQANGDCYQARIEAGQTRVWRIVGGSAVAEPINVGSGIPFTADPTKQTVVIEFAGSAITVKINGSTIATGTDAGISAGGNFGWQLRSLGGFELGYAEATSAETGTPPGIATETDAALALAGKQIRAAGMATETDTALALTPVTLAGLPFNTAPYEFGQRTGLDIEDFALFASTSLNVSIFADADVLLASRLFAYTESTGTDGRLTRKTHASLTASAYYFFVARNADGSLSGCGRIQAT